eukprot:COSAG04_NODE_3049_length_3236_cov_26.473063_1_plen_50_part_10
MELWRELVAGNRKLEWLIHFGQPPYLPPPPPPPRATPPPPPPPPPPRGPR